MTTNDGPPAPRISSPAPDGQVAAGATITVQYTTNQPGLPHEVLLLDSNFNVVRQVAIMPPATGAVTIEMPNMSNTNFYLSIGVPPGVADEQVRHVIKIKTQEIGPVQPRFCTTCGQQLP